MTVGQAHELQRDDRRSARRTQLLDDAIEAIRELGAGVTMDQLARRGGVTKPILYRHFHDRDGLLTAIAEHFATAVVGAVVESIREADDPRELVSAIVDAYLAFLETETDLYRFLVHHTVPRSHRTTSTSPLAEGIARRVVPVIRGHLHVAGFDPDAAAPWAYGMVGMVHQAGDWWLDDRSMPRHALTHHLTDLICEGVGTTMTCGIPPPSAT